MAEKSVDESKMMLRMSDFVSEPKRMLPPIKGYEKEPLITLEQAVKPLHSLVADIEEMVWTVKQNCQHPSQHLSSDESASIMLYTLEWMPRESSFYFILNEALRSQNRQELLPWFLYLRLLIFALSKLPSTKHRIVYRGIKMDVSDEFPEGKTFIWWAFSSCSSSIKVLEQFLGEIGHRTIFNIECDSAKDISQHSFYQSENEVLMYPARQFQVVSSFNSGNQLRIIHVKEIQPPFPLIHIPPTTSATSVHRSKEIEPSFSVMHISQPSATKTTYQNKRLEQLIAQCKDRSKIDLEGQKLADEDMEIVVREAIINKRCMELELSDNKITSIGVSIIAEALNNNVTLEWLILSKNILYDTGIRSLANILSLNNSKITLLYLNSNRLADESAKNLADMLKTNKILRTFGIASNEISDNGIELLAKSIGYHNSTLIWVNLSGNKLISDLSVDYLVEMLKHNQVLTSLLIHSCNFSEKGKGKLRQIAKSKKSFKLDV